MAKSVFTDADVFAVYEAYYRSQLTTPNSADIDFSDLRFYGDDGRQLTADQNQSDYAALAGAMLFGSSGVGTANPLSVSSVRELSEIILAHASRVRSTADAPAQASSSELAARADVLATDMLAQFDTYLAANPSASSFLPSTQEQQSIYRGAVGQAMQDLTQARDVFGRVLAGDESPEAIGLAINASMRVATSILSALPLPPAAKAVVNVVNIATYLVPGIVAAAKGDGDPAALLTIAIQSAASVVSWGVSDYVFDYVLPIVVSAAADAEFGANGQIDLSPTAISQGLIEAAVHDNGGTLPDWWYTATGSSPAGPSPYDRASGIVSSLSGYLDSLNGQLSAQYSGFSNYYQELTLTLNSNLGPVRYYFGRDGLLPKYPVYFAGYLSYETSNPWDHVSLALNSSTSASAGARAKGGLFVLEKDTALFTTGDAADVVYAPAGRPVDLLGGNDSFNLSQDAAGRPGANSNNYYATVNAGAVDGGSGVDTLNLHAVTGDAAAGYHGDLVITHDAVAVKLNDTSGLAGSDQHTILTYSNFETLFVGDIRAVDLRGAALGMKLVTDNSATSTELTEIWGSAHGDTLVIDTGRTVTTRVTLSGFDIYAIVYGDRSLRKVSVDAGAGHDYVAGELVNGASYEGGAGVDTFEILAPDFQRGQASSHVPGGYIVASLDLESGKTWMQTHITGSMTYGGAQLYDVVEQTDTAATVTGFEWAVGSDNHDIVYARNSGSRILGQDGNDTLTGRAGNDQLYGGAGNDVIAGGDGINRLEGGAGDDTITGGANRDVILGGDGNDTLTDTSDGNLISGGNGNDRITTTTGSNEIDAGAGDDVVTSGTGNDVINLGSGLDELNAGAGNDIVSDIWAGGNVDLGFVGGATTRSYRNTVIDGGEGYDTITLDYSGNTVVFEDVATFDAANFTYDIAQGTRDNWYQFYTYNDPNDTTKGGYWSWKYRHQEITNFEEVILTNGTFTVDLISYADLGADFRSAIVSHEIHNKIQTGANDDTVSLGAGNDTFFGNLGNDSAHGEEDADTLDYSRLGSSHAIDMSGFGANLTGTVTINDISGANPTLVNTDTVSGFENIVGTRNDDILVLGNGVNELRGGDGNDFLTGGAGNDRFLFGNADGSDTITDPEIGDQLVFTGPDGSATPVLARSTTNGTTTYTVTFGATTVSFVHADWLDLNVASTTSNGQTTWELTIVDGDLKAVSDSGSGFSATEDAAFVTAIVLGNDTDPGVKDASINSYDTTSVSGATITLIGATGTFGYDPGTVFQSLAEGETTTDTFTYTISDGVTSSTATVTVTISGTNDPVATQLDTTTTTEDAAININVLANDSDVDATDTLSITGTTNGANGTVTLNPDGTVRYLPNQNFFGNDSFTYTVTDGHVSRTETVNVTVTPVTDGIVTSPDTKHLTVQGGNRSVTVDPLANDNDLDHGTLSITGLGTPSNGVVSLNADGSVTYTANAGFSGTDTFTYDVQSSSGVSATETVTITVQTNLAPVTRYDLVRTPEEQAITLNPIVNDSDPNGDPLQIVSVNQPLDPAAGTAVLNPDGTITFTPSTNYDRPVTFTYIVSDGELTSEGFVFLGIDGLPDPPVGNDDHVSMAPGSTSTFNILANDPDPDFGQPRFITSVTPVGDAAIHASFGVVLNQLKVTVVDGFVGQLVYDYTLEDPTGLTSTAKVYINVSNAPDLVADSYTLDEDSGAHRLDVLANDSDVDPGQNLTITSVSQPANGAVVIVESGLAVSYTPDANFTGVETFTYTVSDGLRTSTQTVTLNVTNLADAPVMADDAISTNEDTAVTINVLANDSDAGTASLTVAGHGTANNGTVTQVGDQLIYTPNADFSGTDTFTYTASDGAGGTGTATVTVTVNAINDAPVAPDLSPVLQEDGSTTFDPLLGATDAEGNPISITGVGSAVNGAVVLNSDGTLTYTPNADFSGTDSFTYEITDGSAHSTVTVNLTIEAVNDAPLAVNDIATTAEDTAVIVQVTANDTDPEGDPLTVTSVSAPSNGQVSFSGGEITYTPDADFSGNDQVTYTISDGNGGTSTATLDINVTAVNDAPIVADDSSSANQSISQTVAPLANDREVDGTSLAITALNGISLSSGEFVTLASGAQVFLNIDNTVSFFPGSNYDQLAQGQSLTETVSYTVTDGSGLTSSANIHFTVNGLNDLPLVQADSAATQEDATVLIDVLSNDSDAENDPLSLVAVTNGANGTAEIFDGKIRYTPNADFNGRDQITYTVSDGNGGSTTSTVNIDVTAVNDAPVAHADAVTTGEDIPVSIDVLANDTDADGEKLALVSVTDGANGTVQIVNGQIIYTPNANFSGADQFTYEVYDPAGNRSTASVEVTVTPVEDTPVISGVTSGAVTEDGKLTASGSLVASDVDPTDHPVFTPQANTTGTYGTFSLTSAGDWSYLLDNQAAQVFADGEVFAETFTAIATTFDGETVSQLVSITINGANDVLTALSLTAGSIDENSVGGVAVADVVVSDPDTNDSHTLRLLNDAGGLFVLDGSTLRVADGAILDYEAATSHTVEIEVTDGGGTSIRQSFTMNINDLAETFVAPGDEGSSITGDSGDNEIVGGGGDDTARSGLGKDVVTLGGGKDKVIGTAKDFDGDTITDLDEDDELIFLEDLMSRDAFEFSKETGEASLDTNGDGTVDTTFNLQGNFDNGDFLVFKIGSRTFASFETYLPTLEEGQALNEGHVNGIANQDFLNGDGGRSFSVKLVPVGYAGYRNTLGVYEVAPNGDIVDVRILVADAKSNPRASARIEDVEDGNTLGFFLLQNGGSFASGLSSADTFNFVDANGNSANVDDGADIWFAVNGVSSNRTALHSYAQDMNVDGLEHVLSGVNPDGTSMTVGFEDLTGGGDRDYEDLVFRLTPDDFGSFV